MCGADARNGALSSRTQISACLSVSGALKLNARKKKKSVRIRASRACVKAVRECTGSDGEAPKPRLLLACRLLLVTAPSRAQQLTVISAAPRARISGPIAHQLAALRQQLHRLRSACISSHSVRIRELNAAQTRPRSPCAGRLGPADAHRAQRREHQQPSAEHLRTSWHPAQSPRSRARPL